MQEERRRSERITVELPVTFGIRKNTFFATATNLSDDGMMIEASLARKNFLRIFKPILKSSECPIEITYSILKSSECPIEITYSIAGRPASRRGRVKHYHVDFSGGQSVYRFSFGVWIPKMKMRDQRKL
jgi:hypothetical protein